MGVVGRIVRISGPLVVADNMRGVQMYEMVEVGSDRLIGEVTRIQGDKAFVQVYESTSGLRPGEPVYGTGYPLSVELGPGLLTQIYDGIQRPLSKIIEESKSVFVKRGIKVAPLPRDKKWVFKPNTELKPGDKVSGGDILGIVPETSLIEHKVMVPPDIHGTLLELAPEGEYTIEDPIAVVEAGGRKVEVKMYHRWPARKPRPFKVKLEPTEPLITGMRILDTLFPMAKGGTGAIPGGFGTGKCVPPHTPILLATGEVVSIEEFYRKYKDHGVLVESGEEEVVDVSSLGIRVLTFDGEKLVEAPISHLYKGRSKYMVRVRTKSGRLIEVTPPHKLLKLDRDGRILEIPAAELKPGDQLVVPRHIPVEGSWQKLNPYKLGLEEATVRDEGTLEEIREALRILVGRLGSCRNAAKALGIHTKTLEQIIKGRSRPKLGLVKRLYKLLDAEPPRPRLLGLPRSRRSIRLPEYVDENLAELLGLILSDGMLTERSVRFFSDSEELRARFKELLRKLFRVEGRDRSFRTVKGVEVNSKLLVKVLRAVGVPVAKKSRKAAVPQVILRSPAKVIKAFLRCYYLGDGNFGKNEVELTTASRNMATNMAYLLSRLGILYTIGRKRVGRRIYYRLVITSRDEIEKFYKAISVEWARSLGKVRRIASYLKRKRQGRKARDAIRLDPEFIAEATRGVPRRVLEEAGINIKNYTLLGERIGSSKLVLLAQLTGSIALGRLSKALDYITVDEVVDVEILEGDFTVYDITVPGTHNFVGGEIPTILHNTVTLHSLAQWSAARVVIYIGCGERGNEMTEVLLRFPKYEDPWTGKPLMERTILIANTSNMPVAAREASIYVGVTMAEYYRDMGYDVLLVADSTSRWAEALREIAGRLEEMPAEEGYPSYLASRLAEFYERAGRAITIGKPERVGSVTLVGAVSPPGGDFTEPVTSHTKRFIRVFWALDTALAYSRHYPAINWILSYSAYSDLVAYWWHEHVDPQWKEYRDEAMRILYREDELKEIVKLVGPESLSEHDKLVLEAARIIKEGFLKQNAYDPIDAFTPPEKQFKLLKMMLDFYHEARRLVDRGVPVRTIRSHVDREITELIKAKFTVPNDQLEKLDEIYDRLISKLHELRGASG